MLTLTNRSFPDKIPLVTVQEYVELSSGAPTVNTVSPTLASVLDPVSATVKSSLLLKDKTAISTY